MAVCVSARQMWDEILGMKLSALPGIKEVRPSSNRQKGPAKSKATDCSPCLLLTGDLHGGHNKEFKW